MGIKKLPYKERLKIIEIAIKTLEETDEERMEKAAKALSKDYKTDKNLTAFTDIDLDHFYETRLNLAGESGSYNRGRN